MWNKESIIRLLLIFLSLVLALFLLFSSFFILYANEIIPDRSEKRTLLQNNILYKKTFLWKYVKQTASYKNRILTSEDKSSEFIVKWMIRIFWVLTLWFALTLFMIPTFPEEDKEKLATKSFKLALVIVPIFIIITKVYIFYLNWGFSFTLNWLFDKWNSWLSLIDKIFIIILIIFAFVFVWYLYYYKKRKEEEKLVVEIKKE